jgi:hypothetical protein
MTTATTTTTMQKRRTEQALEAYRRLESVLRSINTTMNLSLSLGTFDECELDSSGKRLRVPLLGMSQLNLSAFEHQLHHHHALGLAHASLLLGTSTASRSHRFALSVDIPPCNGNGGRPGLIHSRLCQFITFFILFLAVGWFVSARWMFDERTQQHPASKAALLVLDFFYRTFYSSSSSSTSSLAQEEAIDLRSLRP